MDEQKCPLDIQMSIRPVDEQKCPLHINICPFVHWTNRNVHWTSKCPFVHWTNGRMVLSNGKHSSLLYPHGVRLSQIRSLQLTWHCKRYICPLDINKFPFVHWANRNVHSSIGRTEMSIGHSNVRSSIGRTEMSIGHSNVHLSIGQTEMSIGHSKVHSSITRTEMSIGHPNVQLSIGRMDEWTLSNSKHSSLLSTWGQTQSDYVITASLAL